MSFSFNVLAQQHDNNIIFGSHSVFTLTNEKQGALLNFDLYPVEVSKIDLSHLNLSSCGFSMSNECGELIFHTNGLSIIDSTNNIMPNGTGLNEGGLSINTDYGYIDLLGLTSVSSPEESTSYNLFHRIFQIDDSINIGIPNILSTQIDMLLNNGKGAVIDKNISIMQGSWLIGLSIIKHGNGRDWWLLSGENYDNRYYKVLLSTEGFSSQSVQQIGFKYPYSDLDTLVDIDSQKLFTPDGKKYIDYDARNGVRIMDFDRCTGELSDYEWIVFDEFIGNGAGASVSPNSRFLYVTGRRMVLQYDLEANDIAASQDTIGILNRVYSAGIPVFTYSQLAPNGKIYIVTGNSNEALHIINNPNEKGAACEFLVHGLVLPNDNRYVLPRYPNYRLYDLPDSPCDTLGINGPPEFDCEE